MSIQIESGVFTDIFGATLPYYQSNSGDEIIGKITVRSAIRISSINNPMAFDLVLNQVTSITESWLLEGFRLGFWVRITKYNGGGGLIFQVWTQINLVDDFLCDFNNLPQASVVQNNESIVFLVVEGDGSNTARSRDDMDILVNHSLNNSNGAPESLIDGEVTRASFIGVGAMVPTNVIVGNLIVKQSGQFLKSAQIERIADLPDGFIRHEITVVIINSGGYDQSWFDSSNCLKLFIKLLWSSVAGEPYARATVSYNFESNTGGFNMPHNTSIADSFLVQGINQELQYCVGAIGIPLIVSGPITKIGIGCMYVPTDTDYYKNRTFPQQEITMTLRTTEAVPGIYNTELNEFGARYTVQVTNVTNVGPETTITISVSANQEFIDFMAAREEGDRLFKIWVKCGNSNLLVYSDQLTCDPVLTGPLIMVQDHGYLDHSENTTTAIGDQTGFVADTEDDIAYVGSFLLEKEDIFDRFIVKLEAFNTATNQDFTLQQQIFSFSDVQISSDGKYLLNESGTSITTLPATSEKRKFSLSLDPSLDVGNEYGVKIYAPWLLNWMYWVVKNDANVDFYPTQNENWQQYSGFTDWVIRTELTLVQGNFGLVHTNEVIVLPYDSEPDIIGGIDVLVESTLQVVQVVPNNTIMRISVKRTNLIGNWDPSGTWGMITIEPKESGQRWTCSSIVPFDNNIQNPLTPLNTNLLIIDYPSPNVAILECLFDTSKIDLTNGVSIGCKIKEIDNPPIFPHIITEVKETLYGLSVRRIATTSVYLPGLPCMTVRRSSDDAELNIGFIGNDLDIVALSAFVGVGVGSQGYVKTWFSQAGNGSNAEQLNHAFQPKIVINGVVNLASNGFPAIKFNGSNQFFNLSVSIPDTTLFSSSFVFERLGTGGAGIIVGFGSLNLGNPYTFVWEFGDDMFTGMGNGNATHAANQLQTGMFHNMIIRDLASTASLYQNASLISPINYPADIIPLTTVGLLTTGLGDIYNTGNIQEMIFWNKDKSNDQNMIEVNTNAYYNNY